MRPDIGVPRVNRVDFPPFLPIELLQPVDHSRQITAPLLLLVVGEQELILAADLPLSAGRGIPAG